MGLSQVPTGPACGFSTLPASSAVTGVSASCYYYSPLSPHSSASPSVRAQHYPSVSQGALGLCALRSRGQRGTPGPLCPVWGTSSLPHSLGWGPHKPYSTSEHMRKGALPPTSVLAAKGRGWIEGWALSVTPWGHSITSAGPGHLSPVPDGSVHSASPKRQLPSTALGGQAV